MMFPYLSAVLFLPLTGAIVIALFLRNDKTIKVAAAIFTGAAGGPVANLAPLIYTVLGAKIVPIIFNKGERRRSVEIPGLLRLAVRAAPSFAPDKEIWAENAHPFNMERWVFAVGDEGSTWQDYGMRWDNSGKNGHYAPLNWSNG